MGVGSRVNIVWGCFWMRLVFESVDSARNITILSLDKMEDKEE